MHEPNLVPASCTSFTQAHAAMLLTKKLSSARTALRHAFVRGSGASPAALILHVWARSGREAAAIKRAFHNHVPADLRAAAALVLVTVTGAGCRDAVFKEAKPSHATKAKAAARAEAAALAEHGGNAVAPAAGQGQGQLQRSWFIGVAHGAMAVGQDLRWGHPPLMCRL